MESEVVCVFWSPCLPWTCVGFWTSASSSLCAPCAATQQAFESLAPSSSRTQELLPPVVSDCLHPAPPVPQRAPTPCVSASRYGPPSDRTPRRRAFLFHVLACNANTALPSSVRYIFGADPVLLVERYKACCRSHTYHPHPGRVSELALSGAHACQATQPASRIELLRLPTFSWRTLDSWTSNKWCISCL